MVNTTTFFNIMIYDKLTSAIYNDVVSGLRGYSNSTNISREQIAEDVVDERLALIKKYIL